MTIRALSEVGPTLLQVAHLGRHAPGTIAQPVSDIIADIQTLYQNTNCEPRLDLSLPPKALLSPPFLDFQPYSGPCSFSWWSYIKPTQLNSIHYFVNGWPPVTARYFAHADYQHGYQWVVYFCHHHLRFYLQGPRPVHEIRWTFARRLDVPP